MELKENLKKLRKTEKLTQKELGDKIHVALRTYANYELGVVEPSLTTLINIADYFNISVDYLIGHRQANKIDLSNLTETQQNIIKATIELNEQNAIRVEAYIIAKLEAQNEQNQRQVN